MSGYTIKLPQFEGPFDLLLFFIERDELDIYDIPISQVTDDFLGYMRQAERMDIDLASEFVLVAATLCRIKAKMLIPRKPVDEEGNEIDPREELVARLLEYKRYKSVLEELRRLETARGMRNYRGNVTSELAPTRYPRAGGRRAGKRDPIQTPKGLRAHDGPYGGGG